MRIAFTILIGIHGVIHLFGFLKGFGLSEFKAISEPITKSLGILWLLTALLFLFTLILLWSNKTWWIMGIIATILSQWLIVMYWKDAKYGTIVNAIMLIAIVFAYASFHFKQKVNKEITQLLTAASVPNNQTLQQVSDLPIPVQRWIKKSGILDKGPVKTIDLEQELQMLMSPEQETWQHGKATQHFSISPPAFHWKVNLHMNPVLEVVGRDQFENGKGEMTIKILSLLPVVNAKSNEKLNQATLQRYLAEIVWFPSAALSPYITWEGVNENSAKAIMSINGTTGSGTFHFDQEGTFEKFVAQRYKDVEEHAKPIEWSVTSNKTEVRDGVWIPVELEATWKLEEQDWTWLKLKIGAVNYKTN
ncbi:MAG: hypothetical protein KDC93_04410 [Cyclobacteriaceae bacterium]|nr:hypothetical protein [Cyclobacteriaceae bacterium]